MGLFDINYTTKVSELLPPDKRDVITKGFLDAFIAPIQYLRDKILGDYRTGSSYAAWMAGTYAKGDKVEYKHIIYESLADSNTDTPPSAKWSVFLGSAIGADTRVRFNGQLITLTYALNTYYKTTYRQPKVLGWAGTADSTHAQYSDIYIANLPLYTTTFRVGKTIGSGVALNDAASYSAWTAGSYSIGDLRKRNGVLYLSLNNSNTDEPPSSKWIGVDGVGNGINSIRGDYFTIYIPSAVYATTTENEIRNLVQPLIVYGLSFTITQY
jgi:hypothetical protein